MSEIILLQQDGTCRFCYKEIPKGEYATCEDGKIFHYSKCFLLYLDQGIEDDTTNDVPPASHHEDWMSEL